MFKRTTKGLLVLAPLALLASACDSGTGPEEPNAFDAERAMDDQEALDLLLSSDAMGVFRAMGQGISFEGMAPQEELALGVVGELPSLADPAKARSAAERIALAVAGWATPPVRSPIISPFNRGKTFAYDAELGRYAWDPDREGAPATGIRFVLYEPGIGGKPDPSAEVGHADLIDEGDGSAEDIALRLVVVDGTDTILDYRTTLDVGDHTGQVTVDGYLQGEYDRLDFQIQVKGVGGEGVHTLDIDFQMGLQARDFQIDGSVSGMASDSGEGGDIDLTVRHGSDSFQVDVSGTESTIDGTVFLNGDLFATVSGSPDDPIFTNADGESPTWVELLVLRQIIDSTEDVFDFWEDLLDPVDELVILAIIF